jgi:MerR family mercuric resistance operon transcriptional regulator
MTKKPLTISEVAKTVGVGVETIRYYQRINLLQQPKKPLQGYRVYSEDALTRLFFIKHAKQLGFSLSEIEILLVPGDEKISQTKKLAIYKLEQVKSKIVDLDYMAKSLEQLILHCDDGSIKQQCSVIDILD